MPSLASPSSLFLSSVASHVTGIQSVRPRLLVSAQSAEIEDVDDAETVDLRSLSSSITSSTVHSRCESCAQIETDFAGAVLFIERYQGPHRILTQPSSSRKIEFYALHQQATVGPCPTLTPPTGLTELELSKWEEWRKLGHMTRQEAMKRYTTVLDNLVDDWRRSANVWNRSMLSSDDSTCLQPFEGQSVTSSNRLVSNLVERLPHMYGEVKELQDRMEDEIKKRDELESHLLHFTQDIKNMLSDQSKRIEQIRNSLVENVKNLDDNVMQHLTELQHLALRQQRLAAQAENSILLAGEVRLRHLFVLVKICLQKRSIRAAFVVLIGLRVWWHIVRRYHVPQLLAQFLIRWLVKVSS